MFSTLILHKFSHEIVTLFHQMGNAAAIAAAFGGGLPPGISGNNTACTILVSNLDPEVYLSFFSHGISSLLLSCLSVVSSILSFCCLFPTEN